MWLLQAALAAPNQSVNGAAAVSQTIAAGKPELLNAKNLERCLAVLAAKPTVPGYADMHVSLTGELETCQALQELLAARK
jgi:hypothetical protein